MATVLTFRFGAAGNFPNNPRLPVVIYQGLRDVPEGGGEDFAVWLEQTWPKHGWNAAWRWGVYEFPHYHSTAHEILGVYRGHATLRLGHTAGQSVEVGVGDVLILPAGTAHQNLGSSARFQVVGGYPDRQVADLMRGEASDRPAADERIARVALPSADPLTGNIGPLVREWGLRV